MTDAMRAGVDGDGTTTATAIAQVVELRGDAGGRRFDGQASPRAAHVGRAYGQLPLRFEPNRGQTDERVRFLSRAGGYNLFLTSGEAVFAPHPARQPLRMRLVGANESAEVVGVDPLPGVSNYFVGDDPSRWLVNVPGFARVRYSGVYQGVDLVYYGLGDGQLEYDFIVSPGADASRVALAFEGARRLRLDASGDLLLRTADGEVRLHRPVAYQERADGGRVEVPARYVVEGKRVRFRLGAYDPRLPLVIDPVVNYATFLGGSGDDRGHSVAVDAQGNAYITGTTTSLNFPVTNGSANGITSAGHTTAYVSKLSPDGSQLLFSTYFGGTTADGGANAGDISNGVGVDAAGNVYVAGYTDSTDFPTVNPFQASKASSFIDSFIVKFSPTGSVIYSTYLGGWRPDNVQGLAVDAAGNAYVTGWTGSYNHPNGLLQPPEPRQQAFPRHARRLPD